MRHGRSDRVTHALPGYHTVHTFAAAPTFLEYCDVIQQYFGEGCLVLCCKLRTDRNRTPVDRVHIESQDHSNDVNKIPGTRYVAKTKRYGKLDLDLILPL